MQRAIEHLQGLESVLVQETEQQAAILTELYQGLILALLAGDVAAGSMFMRAAFRLGIRAGREGPDLAIFEEALEDKNYD